jgi:hypothetical protein
LVDADLLRVGSPTPPTREMSHEARYDSTVEQTHSSGVAPEEREQMLLDDLRVEIARLADAVERQNELLAGDEREVSQ